MSKDDQHAIQTMRRIGSLLFKRLHGNLTELEQLRLDEWLSHQSFATKEFFDEITDWHEVQTALDEMYQFDELAAWEDIQKKIHVDNILAISATPEPPPPVKSRKYKYFLAAVVLILCTGTFVLILESKKERHTSLPVGERFKNDVSPGSQRARLTLSDGSEIVLDSAGQGELTRQGTTKVVKLSDGKLVYQPSSSEPYSVRYNTISTPRGGQYQLVLPDGTRVWLNASSSLKFPTAFFEKERTVELIGEAYFQVAKNSSAPFKVSVVSPRPMEIEVLGTEFNVDAYTDEGGTEATLIDGALRVTAGNQVITLKPRQQARVTNNGTSLQVTPEANIDEVTAWKNGLFQFQDAPIESIMRQVGRWYNVDIVYKGKIDQQFVGKIPRQVQVSTLLKILESTGWVHFMIDGRTITVAP